jgi:hypothetical protein
METKMNLLTKDEALSFNLWNHYFNFLTSIKELFEKELAVKLNGEKITSFVKSDFYEKDGSLKNATKDYPDSEDIYFEVENKEHFIGLCFYYGDASKSGLDLYSKTDKDDNTLRYTCGCKTEKLFLPEMIEAAISWIETGKINDSAKKVFESV